MKKIYLIRHGWTRADKHRLYCGATDLPLTKSGAAELRKAAEEFSYPSAENCRIYTSGMLCAEQTLKLIWGKQPHEMLPALREMNFGDFEMHSYEELKDDAAFSAWLSGDNEVNVCPNGESGVELKKRAIAAFTALAGAAGNAIVVTHGGVIAAIMAHLFPGEGKNRYSWQPSPGCGYAISYEGLRPASYTRLPAVRALRSVAASSQEDWKTKHYSFFSHKECEFFPCHKTDDPDNFNCMFCYCPLYVLGDKCGGNFSKTDSGLKDCSKCLLPHQRNSFGYISECFSRIVATMERQED